MRNKEYEEDQLKTSRDGHLRDSTLEVGFALIGRDDEPPARKTAAREVVEELEAYGIPPGEVSDKPGHRPRTWYW